MKTPRSIERFEALLMEVLILNTDPPAKKAKKPAPRARRKKKS